MDTFFFLCLHPFVIQRIRETVNAQLFNIFVSLKREERQGYLLFSSVFANITVVRLDENAVNDS